MDLRSRSTFQGHGALWGLKHVDIALFRTPRKQNGFPPQILNGREEQPIDIEKGRADKVLQLAAAAILVETRRPHSMPVGYLSQGIDTERGPSRIRASCQ